MVHLVFRAFFLLFFSLCLFMRSLRFLSVLDSNNSRTMSCAGSGSIRADISATPVCSEEFLSRASICVGSVSSGEVLSKPKANCNEPMGADSDAEEEEEEGARGACAAVTCPKVGGINDVDDDALQLINSASTGR